MASSSSSSPALSSSVSDENESPVRIRRRRSALFHLGVSPLSKRLLESEQMRCYIQIRHCNNGVVLSTELTLVYGNVRLLDALRKGRTDPCSIFLDPGAFHEPYRPIGELLRVQDFDVTMATAIEKWNSYKFIVDFDALSPGGADPNSVSMEVSVPRNCSDRFYSVNDIPVIDLGDDQDMDHVPRSLSVPSSSNPKSPEQLNDSAASRSPFVHQPQSDASAAPELHRDRKQGREGTSAQDGRHLPVRTPDIPLQTTASSPNRHIIGDRRQLSPETTKVYPAQQSTGPARSQTGFHDVSLHLPIVALENTSITSTRPKDRNVSLQTPYPGPERLSTSQISFETRNRSPVKRSTSPAGPASEGRNVPSSLTSNIPVGKKSPLDSRLSAIPAMSSRNVSSLVSTLSPKNKSSADRRTSIPIADSFNILPQSKPISEKSLYNNRLTPEASSAEGAVAEAAQRLLSPKVTPPRPRFFAKAPPHLINKRRESFGGPYGGNITTPTRTSTPDGKTHTTPVLGGRRPVDLSPSPISRIKDSSLDVADVSQGKSTSRSPTEPQVSKVRRLSSDFADSRASLDKGESFQHPDGVTSIITQRVKHTLDVSPFKDRTRQTSLQIRRTLDNESSHRLVSDNVDSKASQNATGVASSRRRRSTGKEPRPGGFVRRILRVSLDHEQVPGVVYNSVVAAAKDAKSGDHIVVSAGTYRERSQIALQSGVTLRSANDASTDDVVLIAKAVSYPTLGIRGDNVVVRGLTIKKNMSKSKHSYPAVIDTDQKIKNFQLIDCRVDGSYDPNAPDMNCHFQGIFFDIESSGRIENCRVENMPDHALVTNPDGMVHIFGGVVRRVRGCAVCIARRTLMEKATGACVFVNNVSISDTEDVKFCAEPGQISLDGTLILS